MWHTELFEGAKMTKRSKRAYNILFILTDQERHFDQYPESVSRPAMERLQAKGITFENHQICTSVCTPSRSTIYTGQHIPHSKMFDNTNFPWQEDISTEIPTMGDRMREAGYYTAYKGKWHLTKRFHQEFEAGLELLSMEAYGFSDFDGVGDIIAMTRGGYQYDPMVTSMAIQWLRSQGEVCRQDEQPWLLAVNLVNPHDVMFFNTDAPGEEVQSKMAGMEIAPAPLHNQYQTAHDVALPGNWNQPLAEPGRPVAHGNYMEIHDMMLGQIPPEEEERWQRYQDYYFNCLQDVDVQLGRLLDELDILGLLENTIIIYTSDHGEMAGAHGLRGKGAFAYREHNNVPLIIAHPDFKGGERCQAVTSHVDLVPTMIGMTKLPAAEKAKISNGLPGNDVTTLLEEPQAATYDTLRPAALFAYNMFLYLDPQFIAEAIKARQAGQKPDVRPDVENIRGAIRSITDGNHRFTRYFAPKQHNQLKTLEEILQYNDLELFDLQADPWENNNLARNPEQHRQLIEDLNAKMNALIEVEIGEDKGQMLPENDQVSWAVEQFDP
jgi:arylsulfatase A-like enzyme